MQRGRTNIVAVSAGWKNSGIARHLADDSIYRRYIGMRSQDSSSLIEFQSVARDNSNKRLTTSVLLAKYASSIIHYAISYVLMCDYNA